MCGGGGAPPPPPLDPAAVALEQKQLELLNQQQQQQAAFMGLAADQYGYTVTKTPKQVTNPAYAQAQAQLNALQTALDRGPNASSGNTGGAHGNSPNITLYQVNGQSLTKTQVQDRISQQQAALGQLPQTVASTSDFDVAYGKTPEREAQDKALADLQSQQLTTAKKANDALDSYLASLDTPEYKAQLAAQQQLQDQQTQVALAQGERTKQALAGQLPLSQGTIQRKAQEFQSLKENLAKSGNAIIGDDASSAYSLSSPGSQALKEFNSRYAAIEDQERQGTLDAGSQAYLQAVGLTSNIGNSGLSTTSALSNPGGYAGTSNSFVKGSPVSNNLGLVQGYGQALNPYLQQQQLQTQVGMANAQMDQQNQAGWMQLGGTVLGLGAYGAMKSSKGMKKNIRMVSKGEKDNHEKADHSATLSLVNTPVYKWNYKAEPDGAKPHMGTMTETAPDEIVTHDGKHLDATSYFGLLTNSTKDIHRRLSRLEGRA